MQICSGERIQEDCANYMFRAIHGRAGETATFGARVDCRTFDAPPPSFSITAVTTTSRTKFAQHRGIPVQLYYLARCTPDFSISQHPSHTCQRRVVAIRCSAGTCCTRSKSLKINTPTRRLSILELKPFSNCVGQPFRHRAHSRPHFEHA